MYPASGDTTKHFSKRVFHLWFSSMYFSPVIFHPPTLASLTGHLTRTCQLRTALLLLLRVAPEEHEYFSSLKVILTPGELWKHGFPPGREKGNLTVIPCCLWYIFPRYKSYSPWNHFVFCFVAFGEGRVSWTPKQLQRSFCKRDGGWIRALPLPTYTIAEVPGGPLEQRLVGTLFNPNEKPS